MIFFLKEIFNVQIKLKNLMKSPITLHMKKSMQFGCDHTHKNQTSMDINFTKESVPTSAILCFALEWLF